MLDLWNLKHQPLIGSLPPTIQRQIHFENNVYQAGFDASWEIDVFGGNRRAVESASAQLLATEYERGDVLLTLLATWREIMWTFAPTSAASP